MRFTEDWLIITTDGVNVMILLRPKEAGAISTQICIEQTFSISVDVYQKQSYLPHNYDH